MSTQAENDKKIKTDGGNWIKASYKTGKYEDYKQKQNVDFNENDGSDNENEDSNAAQSNRNRLDNIFNRRRNGTGQKRDAKQIGGLIKPEQILAKRKKEAKKRGGISRGGGSRGGSSRGGSFRGGSLRGGSFRGGRGASRGRGRGR